MNDKNGGSESPVGYTRPPVCLERYCAMQNSLEPLLMWAVGGPWPQLQAPRQLTLPQVKRDRGN
jgi:hypothetical protein